ncbi:MAG TPA: pre-peptidase C-terminal domain-containing protein, partial [Candidatus Acidoferrales bacterium]|nr:pre-peptidase C-terminal domain-containing protein [Candidatus Acidoferrales bacterium]
MKARRGTQQGSMVFRRAVQRVASAVAVTALAGLVALQAVAQPFLACGVPVTHHLASGSTDTYQATVSGGLQTVFDATDTGGTLGLLQLTGLDYFCDYPVAPCFQTCNGSLASPNSDIAVSDCIGSDAGDYTVEFNVVQQGPENCGVPLTCGVAPTGTALSVPGEVDAYTFSGVAGQQISVATTATGDSTGSLRLRLYSPTGDSQGDSCSGSLTYNVPSTGTYTVLVSACVAPSTGPYTITWQTLPACPAVAAAGFAYVAYAESNTVGVIDLATNQTVSILPRVIPKSDIPFGAITTSPNDGLAYVTFGTSGTISIINTTLNRAVGSLNVPDDSGHDYTLHIALDPQGRYAYAPSDVLRGVVVINTVTRKSEAVIPFPFLDSDIGDGF